MSLDFYKITFIIEVVNVFFAPLLNDLPNMPTDEKNSISLFFVEQEETKEIQVEIADDPEDSPSILEVAHSNHVCLEGACEGSLACSTCHVFFDQKDYDLVGDPSEEEDDMLDLAFGLTQTSRLGCQIKLSKQHDGMKIYIPKESRNLSS